MNILIPDSWLREYLQTNAIPSEIQKCLSLCGPSIERLKQVNNDWVYDVEVTTNRVDCMSVYGIAREAAAILPQFGFTAKLVSNPFKLSTLNTKNSVDYLDVTLDETLCSNFSALLIKNVKVGASPTETVRKLESVNMRSLNNVVDVSNLLMHALGQPVHTFDYDKIQDHKMILRLSQPNEEITTLDNQTHKLAGGDIVIEDGSGQLIDLCGIMGGANSAVDESTKNVLLFVQTYNPVNIRRTSMATGVRTSAAVIFEKNLSSESVLPTLALGTKILRHFGGKPDTQILSISSTKSSISTLTVSSPLTKFASDRLGVPLTTTQTSKILTDLGFKITADKNITVPWYRKYDIEIPEDLVEEIARIYGYHNLPSILMSGELPTIRPLDQTFYWERQIRLTLKNWGYTEAFTYSLTPEDSGLKLKNPLSSEWDYLRTNLTKSHLAIISENIGRIPELNFFEIAKVYLPQKASLPSEIYNLVISTTNLDFRRLKGIIEGLSQILMIDLPITVSNFGTCLIFECTITDFITKASTVRKFTPISKFSPIIEDVNLNYKGNYSDLVAKLTSLSPLIKKIDLVDIYESKLTVRITYHSDTKQLSREDIAPVRNLL